MKVNKKRVILYLAAFLLILIITYNIWGNLTVGTTCYDISSGKLPGSFDGYRIAQISDLHNAEFGRDNSKIIRILEAEQPDIIVFTGDIIASNRPNFDIALNFARQAMEIAPCYYVTGNHEAYFGEACTGFENKLAETGVIVLHDEIIKLTKGNESIQLIGLDDPRFGSEEPQDPCSILENKLREMNLTEGFKVLLSHRPDAFDACVENEIDMVLSGHVHGGQFRLPFIGGLLDPSRGIFPKYDSGVYTKSKTTMIVSRGIGNSIIPVRINNRPEVVIVRLHSES